MTNQTSLPENDLDLKLAEEYGTMHESQHVMDNSSDSLLTILFNVRRESIKLEENILVTGKQEVWNQVQAETSKTSNPTTSKISFITSVQSKYWMAAALIMITLTSIFFIQQALQNRPQLIASADTQIASIILSDGSQVTLRPGTQLFRLSETTFEQAYALDGEAYFEISKNLHRKFMVETGGARVVVTGTTFNLRNRGKTAEVFLIEGSVSFETLNRSQSVQLAPGEASSINPSSDSIQTFSFDPSEVIGWTKQRLIFNNRTLKSIIEELEDHYQISIQIPDSSMSEILGGSIQLDDVTQSLNDLGVVLDGNFVKIADSIYEFRPVE